MVVPKKPNGVWCLWGWGVGGCAWISCSLWPVLSGTWLFRTKKGIWRKGMKRDGCLAWTKAGGEGRTCWDRAEMRSDEPGDAEGRL